jgi:hypothetical protein
VDSHSIKGTTSKTDPNTESEAKGQSVADKRALKGRSVLTSGGPKGRNVLTSGGVSRSVLERRDQGPYRHDDKEQDQDHDDEGYEGATAHATALLGFVSIWRLILAAGRRCCQLSELVRVEYPALRRRRPVFD